MTITECIMYQKSMQQRRKRLLEQVSNVAVFVTLGYRQTARHRILVPAFPGSSPGSPVSRNAKQKQKGIKTNGKQRTETNYGTIGRNRGNVR